MKFDRGGRYVRELRGVSEDEREDDDDDVDDEGPEDIDKRSYKQERKLKLTTTVAYSWQNVERNRYRNVLAYDTSRVLLKRITSSDQSDYINASPLLVPLAKRNYILTQGPLLTTSADFWQMVWEQNSPLIIMLNKLVEKDLPKCHDYYPTTDCPSREFDSFNVILKDEQNFDHYIIRDLELLSKYVENSSEENHHGSHSRAIKHFQFISWPDFGVPQSTSVFIEFLQKVRDTGLLSEERPTVVHCSAGIGRSGTFVVADSVLSMVEGNVKTIDVASVVVEMRKSRMGLIQTPQQLQFCWKTIADALRQGYITINTGSESKMNADEKRRKELLTVPNNRIGEGTDEMPHLERSQANQMTTDSHAKSCTDLTTVRKRTSNDSHDTEKEAKQAKRKERVDKMRARLLKCEDDRKKWHYAVFGHTGAGYACAAVAAAFAVYLIYRITS